MLASMAQKRKSPPVIHDRCHNLISAALRHLHDAEHLAQPDQPFTSLDQAQHLAGFSAECARKALLDLTMFPPALTSSLDKLIGHDFGALAEEAIAIAQSLNPALRDRPVLAWGQRHPALRSWHPDVRYHGTGTAARAEVGAQSGQRPVRDLLLPSARSLFEEAALTLWVEGRLDGAWQ